MDVSDGLLIDAGRLAEASGRAIAIALDCIPLHQLASPGPCASLAAATAGDDYELLFTASPDRSAAITRLSETLGLPLTRIGSVASGAGLSLTDHAGPVPLPDRLGYQHRSA